MSRTDPAQPFRDEIAKLAAIPDLTERARAVAYVLDAVPALQAQLRGVRQVAVTQMRATRSLAEVAEELGVSQPRISQITRGVSRSAKH